MSSEENKSDPKPQQYNMDYCMYCWREAENTTKGNPDEGKIPVCSYHKIQFAADVSKDSFAEKMGYEDAEDVVKKYQDQEQPKITINEAIALVNNLTDPRGSGYNNKDPVVYSEEIRVKLAEKAQEMVKGDSQ